MKTKEELTALKEECKTLTAKLEELSDEELKEVNGGFFIPDFNDPYWGMDPSCFGNLQIGDRVKRYNILGTYVWHEGTVQGFCMTGGVGVLTGNPIYCRVLVKWDDVGTCRADGCLEEFPSNLTKI